MIPLPDTPVKIRALLFRREVQVAFLIGALLMIVPFWINHARRSEQLSRAILNGRDEAAEQMITDHPDLLDKPDEANGFAPLHWAVIAGRTNLFFWLIEKGAAVDAKDRDGMTPLHKAAVFNRLDFADTLIQKGASVSALGRKYGSLRLAPIHLAAEEGHADMVLLLISRGADVDSATEGANRVTPLHMAAAQGREAVVECLIEAGADINICDLARKTPLAWAIESNQPGTAALLRQAGAVP